MSFRKTLIAAVVLALAAAAYFFIEKPHVKHSSEEKESKAKVLTLNWDTLDSIRLQTPAGEILLAKSGKDQWKVTKPFDDDADKYTVQGLISAVRTARPDRVLDAPEALANYGLAEPRLTAAFTAKGVTESLLIGASHKIGDSVFAKRADGASVYVLPGSILTELSKPAETFRDKTIIQAAWGDPDRVELLREGQPAWVLASEKVEKPAAGDAKSPEAPVEQETVWKLLDPAPWWRADKKGVDDVLRGVRELRIEDVLSEKPDKLPDRGLEPARMTLRVHYPSGQEVKLDIGNKFGDQGYVQAVSPKGFLVTMKDAPVKKIDVAPAVLEDKSLAEFNVSDVLRVELHEPSTSIILTRPSGGDFTSEGSGPLDSEKVLADLRRLVDLAGTRILEGDERSAAQSVLEKPGFGVKLLGAGDKVLADIRVARMKKKEVTEPIAVARGNLADAVFEVAPAILDGWPASLDDLKPSKDAKPESKDGQPELEKKPGAAEKTVPE